jgi:uncharacterized Tic20 family protein
MENPAPYAAPQPQPLSPSDEHTWALLAHLSILINLFTGVLGPVAALVIYLVYKDRSRYVAYQAMQSFIFQLIVIFGGGTLVAVSWALSSALAVVLIGFLCMPIALLFTIAVVLAPIYSIIGAVQCNSGQDFKYWLIGDWVRSTLTG